MLTRRGQGTTIVGGGDCDDTWSATYPGAPESGATSYEIVRSIDLSFDSGCTVSLSATGTHTDSVSPPIGEIQFYLVRAIAPGTGSWGVDGSGADRALSCAP